VSASKDVRSSGDHQTRIILQCSGQLPCERKSHMHAGRPRTQHVSLTRLACTTEICTLMLWRFTHYVPPLPTRRSTPFNDTVRTLASYKLSLSASSSSRLPSPAVNTCACTCRLAVYLSYRAFISHPLDNNHPTVATCASWQRSPQPYSSSPERPNGARPQERGLRQDSQPSWRGAWEDKERAIIWRTGRRSSERRDLDVVWTADEGYINSGASGQLEATIRQIQSRQRGWISP